MGFLESVVPQGGREGHAGSPFARWKVKADL